MFVEESAPIHRPNTIDEARYIIKEAVNILPRGSGTKPALSKPPEGFEVLEMGGLRGVLEYDPDELTFTALAGTRIRDLNRMLAEQGQYLPFDPPLVDSGATIGGTVAAGVSGPGRYHYGGVGDFLLGVRYINSAGELVSGGGKVVKTVAGFDLPKLMVGSLGGLGALVELTLKVFPKPEAYTTLRLDCENLDQSLGCLQSVADAHLDVAALDLEPYQGRFLLFVRLGGLAEALPARLEYMMTLLGATQVRTGEEEERLWGDVGELDWVPDGWSLVKVPLTPRRIPALENSLEAMGVRRRYLSGGQVAWLALEGELATLDGLLTSQGLLGLPILGPRRLPRLGKYVGESFYRRVKKALDPFQRFVEI